MPVSPWRALVSVIMGAIASTLAGTVVGIGIPSLQLAVGGPVTPRAFAGRTYPCLKPELRSS